MAFRFQPRVPEKRLEAASTIASHLEGGRKEGRGPALKSDGTVRTWGRNDEGEAGNRGDTSSLVPAQVPDVNNVKNIDLYQPKGLVVDAEENLVLLDTGHSWIRYLIY